MYHSGFDDLIADGKRLEDVLKYHAGYLGYYASKANMIESLADYYDKETSRVRARVLQEWSDNPPWNTIPTQTQMNKMVESEDRVIEADRAHSEFKFWAKQYRALHDAWRQRGYDLNNIVKLREKDMEDVTI